MDIGFLDYSFGAAQGFPNNPPIRLSNNPE